MRYLSVATSAAMLMLLAGCGASSLPTVPSDLTSGVAIYEDANYNGGSALVTEDVKDLKDVKGPCPQSSGETVENRWNDCISSIRVSPGWRATLYVDDGFEGAQLEVTADTPNLEHVAGGCSKGRFNYCVTAIRVFRP
jgi:hypothetical protein